MDKLIQTLISGLSLGSIYALIALGYTMVYGIAKMLNFAHGDIIMVGAYAVITAAFTMGLPPFIAILISIALCALLGIVIEFLAYRPLRQAQPLAVLITAIGVSYLLQNLALLIYGSEQKAFPTIVALPTVFTYYLKTIQLLALVFTVKVVDMFAEADIFSALYNRRTEPYIADAIAYWTVAIILPFFFSWWEKKLRTKM